MRVVPSSLPSMRALAACALAVALVACAERPATFTATYSGAGDVSLTAAPARDGAIVFAVRKSTGDAKGNPIYARPGGTMLKIPGYLPVMAESVDDAGESYVVVVPLPEDALRAAREGRGAGFDGELFIPLDRGVRSFTGIERHVPDTARVSARVVPQPAVPLPWLADLVSGFLRSLYAAR